MIKANGAVTRRQPSVAAHAAHAHLSTGDDAAAAGFLVNTEVR